MATNPADTPQNPPEVAELPPAPLSGTRSQALQRLQIGLFGLGAMVLLVALANIIKTSAQENEARVVPEAASTTAAKSAGGEVSDPLADAGVVPDLPGDQDARTSANGDAASARP